MGQAGSVGCLQNEFCFFFQMHLIIVLKTKVVNNTTRLEIIPR